MKSDLVNGIAAAERILGKSNEAVERSVLDEALEELISRVDDWKNHRVEQFGRLLRHGNYSVVTGRSDQEKEVWHRAPLLPARSHGCVPSMLTFF
jgi:cell division control protein 24